MSQEVGPISSLTLRPQDADVVRQWRGQRSVERPAMNPAPDVRQAFERTLAGWVGDLLSDRPSLSLVTPEAMADAEELADYHDRDWRRLYRGSVLDD